MTRSELEEVLVFWKDFRLYHSSNSNAKFDIGFEISRKFQCYEKVWSADDNTFIDNEKFKLIMENMTLTNFPSMPIGIQVGELENISERLNDIENDLERLFDIIKYHSNTKNDDRIQVEVLQELVKEKYNLRKAGALQCDSIIEIIEDILHILKVDKDPSN